MIEYALDNGYECLNFYGISGNFDEDNPRIGLFHFKRDFGCKVVELLGEFDLVNNQLMYIVYKFAMYVRRQVKKIKKRNQ
jgi:lipid II:glycine glycyltransferase (peptidoglycan interpeptide bridge formation enzyme)